MKRLLQKLSKENKKNLLIMGSGLIAGGVIALALIFAAPGEREKKETAAIPTQNSSTPPTAATSTAEKNPLRQTYAESFNLHPSNQQECIKKTLGVKLHNALMSDPDYVIPYEEGLGLKEAAKCYKKPPPIPSPVR